MAMKSNRREFLAKAAVTGTGLSLAGMIGAPVSEQVAFATQRVRTQSTPTDLRITDVRVTQLQGVPFRQTIVRIDTNQGISGFGEGRDDADPRYYLLLKSRLLNQNPLDVQRLIKRVWQFGGSGRVGAGVSGVEIALWDIAGKAYEVPCYQLLGGAYRKQIRAYADASQSSNPNTYAQRMKARADQGYTWLKMDLGIELIQNVPGAFNGRNLWPGQLNQWSATGAYAQTLHPFTRIQLTDVGLDRMAEYVATVRDVLGYGIPIGHDHMGHFGIEDQVKLANRLAEFSPAFMEDVVAWFYVDQFRYFREHTDVPVMTGEDIFGLQPFKDLIDANAVDLVHPDVGQVGGMLEAKKVGDYAEEHGVAMAMHGAYTPIATMAACHVAAATQNFVALEHHAFEIPNWEQLADGLPDPWFGANQPGFYPILEKPGLGIELSEEGASGRIRPGTGWFTATPEWNQSDSWDRIWT